MTPRPCLPNQDYEVTRRETAQTRQPPTQGTPKNWPIFLESAWKILKTSRTTIFKSWIMIIDSFLHFVALLWFNRFLGGSTSGALAPSPLQAVMS